MVVLGFVWLVVFIVGSQHTITTLSGTTILFLVLSGLATGASWLCYFRALQEGPASVVVPVDKTSIVLTVVFAWLFLGERLSRRAAAGLVLIMAGTLLMLL